MAKSAIKSMIKNKTCKEEGSCQCSSASLKKELEKEKDHCASWQRKAMEYKQEISGLRAESDMETASLRRAEELINRLRESLKVDREMHKYALEDVKNEKQTKWILVSFLFGFMAASIIGGLLIRYTKTEPTQEVYRGTPSFSYSSETKSKTWEKLFHECQSDWRSQNADIANLKNALEYCERRTR